MMDKQGVYRFLREQGVEYECVEHPAAYNMEEMSHIALPYPEADATRHPCPAPGLSLRRGGAQAQWLPVNMPVRVSSLQKY